MAMDPLVVSPTKLPLTSRASHFSLSSLASPFFPPFTQIWQNLYWLKVLRSVRFPPLSHHWVWRLALVLNRVARDWYPLLPRKSVVLLSLDVLGSDSNMIVQDAPRCSILALVAPNTGERVASVQHELAPKFGVANQKSPSSPNCPSAPDVPIGSFPTKSWAEVARQSYSRDMVPAGLFGMASLHLATGFV